MSFTLSGKVSHNLHSMQVRQTFRGLCTQSEKPVAENDIEAAPQGWGSG